MTKLADGVYLLGGATTTASRWSSPNYIAVFEAPLQRAAQPAR